MLSRYSIKNASECFKTPSEPTIRAPGNLTQTKGKFGNIERKWKTCETNLQTCWQIPAEKRRNLKAHNWNRSKAAARHKYLKWLSQFNKLHGKYFNFWLFFREEKNRRRKLVQREMGKRRECAVLIYCTTTLDVTLQRPPVWFSYVTKKHKTFIIQQLFHLFSSSKSFRPNYLHITIH